MAKIIVKDIALPLAEITDVAILLSILAAWKWRHYNKYSKIIIYVCT